MHATTPAKDDNVKLNYCHKILILSETVESENFLNTNTMKIKAQVTNVSISKLQKLNKMPKTESLKADKNHSEN